MKYRVTLKTAIIITKYATTPLSCWPLSPDASTANVFRYNFIWWFTIVHIIGCMPATIYSIYQNRHDPDVIVSLSIEAAAMLAIAGKLWICRKDVNLIRSLLAELEMFLNRATDEQSKLIQSYVDRSFFAHMSFFASAVIGTVVYILGPAVMPQPLPGDTGYPFSLESYWVWAPLYVSQSLIVVQTASMAILDFMFAILLWYSGARCEMLSNKLARATNVDDVVCCVREHQELIEYVERVKVPTGIMALGVTVTAMFAVTTGGFVIVRRPPLYIAAKFLLFELVAMWEIFIYTWPANNLMEMSEKIGEAAFGCAWIGNPPQMTNNLIFIMQRSQNPLVIAVDGLLPALSLKLYATAMTTSFSYVTTLRAFTET